MKKTVAKCQLQKEMNSGSSSKGVFGDSSGSPQGIRRRLKLKSAPREWAKTGTKNSGDWAQASLQDLVSPLESMLLDLIEHRRYGEISPAGNTIRKTVASLKDGMAAADRQLQLGKGGLARFTLINLQKKVPYL